MSYYFFTKLYLSLADEENGDDEGDTPSSRSRRERRSTRRSEGRKGRDLPLDNAALQEILDVLMHDPDAPPFLRPVARSEVCFRVIIYIA